MLWSRKKNSLMSMINDIMKGYSFIYFERRQNPFQSQECVKNVYHMLCKIQLKKRKKCKTKKHHSSLEFYSCILFKMNKLHRFIWIRKKHIKLKFIVFFYLHNLWYGSVWFRHFSYETETIVLTCRELSYGKSSMATQNRFTRKV